VSAIAATSTRHYVNTHGTVSLSNGVALDHGFQTALYVLTGLLIVGALVSAGLIRPQPRPAEAEPATDDELAVVDEAA
jgi:hypothetical protein